MSNRSRLILLSGTTVESASRLAESTAVSLAERGQRVLKLNANRRGRYRIIEGGIVAALAPGLERLLVDAGSELLPMGATESFPGMRELSLLDHLVAGLTDPSIDVIVVDCGDLDRARSLIEIPAGLLVLLDSMLTPRLAMWRGVTQVEGAATVFEELSVARGVVARALRSLRHEQTTMRIAMRVREHERVTTAIAALSVLGVAVDGACITGRRKGRRGQRRERTARRRLRSCGVASWVSKSGRRPAPGSHGVLEVLSTPVVVVDDLGSGGDYSLEVPLMKPARKRVRVGRIATDLILEFDGARRQLPLPSGLARCRVVDAWRGETGIRLRFEPDEHMWPEGAA